MSNYTKSTKLSGKHISFNRKALYFYMKINIH